MNFRYLTVDPQGGRSCIAYLNAPDPNRQCIIPVTRDWYVTGVREDLWSIVNRGSRIIVLELSAIHKTGSHFTGALLDIKSWLRVRSGDLRLCGIRPDLRPWFSVVLGGDPVYRTRRDALIAPLPA